MKRAEAIEWLEVMKEDAIFEQCDALKMAIEALSKPNYESDTEVRLAVTDRNKDKVVLWDAFGEVEYYPNGEINCVNCPHYYETEDETGVHGHCDTNRPHGEWIDKGDDAECSRCGAHSGTQFDGVEPIPLKTKFCHNCGARMKGDENE